MDESNLLYERWLRHQTPAKRWVLFWRRQHYQWQNTQVRLGLWILRTFGQHE